MLEAHDPGQGLAAAVVGQIVQGPQGRRDSDTALESCGGPEGTCFADNG